MKLRSVENVIPAVATYEGAGFLVHRPFPSPSLDHLDPFLLLDEMGPSDLGPGEAKGAPDHPHRGFETVTYLLSGAMQHKDSQGNRGQLRPGDVQWMTAGSGVVHSEMPEPSFAASGGRMHGFQLWVNLPARDKMTKPRYQEIPASGIPVGKSEDGNVTARVIAGEALGQGAVIETRTPIFYLDYELAPGASLEHRRPRSTTCSRTWSRERAPSVRTAVPRGATRWRISRRTVTPSGSPPDPARRCGSFSSAACR
jgi:redox-sensitive bicupin YhaK (pirin superfamily)